MSFTTAYKKIPALKTMNFKDYIKYLGDWVNGDIKAIDQLNQEDITLLFKKKLTEHMTTKEIKKEKPREIDPYTTATKTITDLKNKVKEMKSKSKEIKNNHEDKNTSHWTDKIKKDLEQAIKKANKK